MSAPSSPNDRLCQYVDTCSNANKTLPSTHITNAYNFPEILSSSMLEPKECKVFGEDLSYFFYGRPAYRTRKTDSVALGHNLPIVFIVDTEKLRPLKRIFPFDSGAFDKGFYNGYFDSRCKIENFELPANLEVIKKLVDAFYGDNRDYLLGNHRDIKTVGPYDFEVEGLTRLIQDTHTSKEGALNSDERSTSFEIQITQSLKLEEILLCVLLPQVLLDDTATFDAIKAWKPPEIIPYHTLRNSSSEHLAGTIYTKVIDYYNTQGWLS